MTSLLPENRVAILIGWLSKWDCRLIFSGSHQWHACVEFKQFYNLYHKQQNCSCLRNWIAKFNCEWRIIVVSRVGFSFRTALWFLQWFCLRKVFETNNFMLSFNLRSIFTFKCNDSVSFFLVSLFFFFLRQGPNSFFSIKGNCCVI